jgi:acetyltransferase-like isoleucine patch superfamily enzyme
MKILYYVSRLWKKMSGKAILNSKIHKTSKVESGSQIINVTMGKHSFCGYDCTIINCEIGSFCSISNGVVIGGGMHPIDWVSTSPVFYQGRDSVKKKYSNHTREPQKRTHIGNDVWIGERVLIKQGIVIGHGAIIGMGSIVTKDVEPYTIVGGNPARFIRKRFAAEIVEDLLSIKFWDMVDQDLIKYAEYIKDPVQFIKEVKK